MAIAGKGKGIAGKSPASASSATGKRRKGGSEAESSAGGHRKKRRNGGLKFVDDAAYVAESDSDEDEDGDEEMEDEYASRRGSVNQEKYTTKDAKGAGRSSSLPFFLKEEELSGDELEELIRDRYRHDSGYVGYEEDYSEHDEDSTKDATIWRVKCMVGRERQIVFCLMQKYVDLHNLGTTLQITSAFSSEHVKGYVYVEAKKECDVIEACKGFCNVYSSISLVPKNEIPHLLAVRSKACGVLKGTWVRVKNGNYRGDLAQVVAVDEERKKATIKLVPRIDLQSIAKKLGGGVSLKHASIPPARLINPRELEEFRPLIQSRRDRLTGEIFEILDGLMLKDGYLYKKVSISSLVCWGVEPSKAECQKFTEAIDAPENLNWISSVYGESKKMQCTEASSSKIPDKQGNSYGLHDLVLFGKKSFGVITSMDKDCYQILKGDMEEPVVLTVKLQDIKNVCVDKLFRASDCRMKTIAINDIVNILEGPHQGRQGIIKHMYKGMLFLFDENQKENGGYFCVKSNLCESIKESGDDLGVKSRSSTETSTRQYLQQDTARNFSRSRQNYGDQAFSIGQTLRIRKGPLKGYLCRVVGIYRSDVTVKLDSLVKIITVQENLLSEPNVRREASTATSDIEMTSFGRDSWQVFSAPAFASGDDHKADNEQGADPWGIKATNWGDKEQGADPWGSKAAIGKDKEPGADPWGSKAATGKDKEPGADPWGSNAATGKDKEPGVDPWGSKAAIGKDKEPGADPWGSKAAIAKDKEPGADPWGSKAVIGKDKEPGADPWGNKAKIGEGKEQGSDPWGSKATIGEDKKLGVDPWGSKLMSGEGQEHGADAWGSKVTPEAGGNSGSNRDSDSWMKATNSAAAQNSTWKASVPADQGRNLETDSGGWNKASVKSGVKVDTWESQIPSVSSNWNKAKSSTEEGKIGNWDHPSGSTRREVDSNNKDWDIKGKSTGRSDVGTWGKSCDQSTQPASEHEGQASSWDNVKITSGGQTDNWGKAKTSNDSELGGWHKGGSSNQSQTEGWGKPNSAVKIGGQAAISLDNVKTTSDSQTDNLVKTTDSSGTGGWNKAGSGRQSQTDGWNVQKPASQYGGQTDNWGKSKDSNDSGTGGWNKVGSSSKNQTDGWNVQKPASQYDGRTDNWGKSKDSNDSGTGGWNKGGSSSKSQTDAWNKPKSFGGENVPSWNNLDNEDTGVNDKKVGWDKHNFEGGRGFGRGRGRGRGWERGHDDSDVAGDNGDQENSLNWQRDFDGDGGRGRGRGRYGGRGRDQDSGGRGSSFGNSGGSWGSGRGGRGRNGSDSDDTRPFGRGRGRGRGRFDSSDWKNDNESSASSAGGNFSRNTVPSWSKDQNSGWENTKGFGKNDELTGNSDKQHGGWNGSTSIGGKQQSNWNSNQTSSGWNSPKDFSGKGPSNSGDKEAAEARITTSSWDNNQNSGWQKTKGFGKNEESTGNLNQQQGGWDRGNSFAVKQSPNWNSNEVENKGGWNTQKTFSSNYPSSSDNKTDVAVNTTSSWAKDQTSGWEKTKGSGKYEELAENLDQQQDGWNRGNSFSGKQSSDGNSSDGKSGWNTSKAFGNGGGAGGWNKAGSSCQGQADEWNKPKSFGGHGSSWNKVDNDNAGVNDQRDSWGKDRTFEGGRGSGRGRGRGRGWGRGQDGDGPGDNEDRDTGSNPQRDFGGGRGSGWGRGRGRYGGGRDQDSGERGSNFDAGGNWGSGRGGRGRNGDGSGPGRGRGRGRFQSTDWKNVDDNSGGGAFSRNSVAGWGNDQNSGWGKKEFTKIGESAGNLDQKQDCWSSGNSFGGKQSSNWNSNDSGSGWNTPKGFGGNRACSSDNKEAAGAASSASGWGNDQNSCWGKKEFGKIEESAGNVDQKQDGRNSCNKSAGKLDQKQDGWNIGNSFGGKPSSNWKSNDRGSGWSTPKGFGDNQTSSSDNKEVAGSANSASGWGNDQNSCWGEKEVGKIEESAGNIDQKQVGWNSGKSFGGKQSSNWNSSEGGSGWNTPIGFGGDQTSSVGNKASAGAANVVSSWGNDQNSGWEKTTGFGKNQEAAGNSDGQLDGSNRGSRKNVPAVGDVGSDRWNVGGTGEGQSGEGGHDSGWQGQESLTKDKQTSGWGLSTIAEVSNEGHDDSSMGKVDSSSCKANDGGGDEGVWDGGSQKNITAAGGDGSDGWDVGCSQPKEQVSSWQQGERASTEGKEALNWALGTTAEKPESRRDDSSSSGKATGSWDKANDGGGGGKGGW